MELVYLWVEKYKNIHEQGFNFSPKFNCHYDGETLTIKDNVDEDGNKKNIENFFGDNINVTAIVGKNGSGKSSVLECIKIAIELFIEQKEYVSFSEYLEFLENVPHLEFLNFQNPYILVFQNEDLFYNISINSPKNINTNFITNHIENNILQNYSLYPFIKEELPLQLILDTFFFPKKIIDFFNPDRIVINLTKWLNQEICLSHSIKEQLDYIVKELKNNLSTNQDKEYQNLFIIQNYIENNDLDEFKELEQMFYIFDFSKDLTQELQIFLLALNTFSLIEIFDSRKYENYMKLEAIPLSFGMSYNHLSNGEKHLLSVLLSIRKIVYTKDRTESILIFLDELESELHPEWQRTIILELINSCNLNTNIHFIITSHSPFILSDLPKQNIIFLDKDESGNCKIIDELNQKNQTFGANIHTLLSDSFFMEGGLMGEFAKQKINEIIDFFNNKNEIYKDDKEKLLKIINTIGEPFLKDKLLFMYNEKYPKTDDEKIKELEAEIQRIKNG